MAYVQQGDLQGLHYIFNLTAVAESGSGTPCAFSPPGSGASGNNGTVAADFMQGAIHPGWTHTSAYQYDSLNRLATAVATGSSQYSYTFSYDRYGNMTCTTTNGQCDTLAYNQSTNQINSNGYTYDAAGDLTKDFAGNTYQWDGEGRLASVDNGSTNTFAYNALGQWVYWQSGNSPNYVYDPWGHDVGYFDPGSGSWIAQMIPLGGRILASYSNGGAGFPHVNALGSDTMATGYGGSVVWDFLAYPWGRAWTSQEGLFAGFSDVNTMIDTYAGRARQYSFNQGRWLTPDPLGGDLTNPQSLNRYAYVLNNPATLIDPLGLGQCSPQAEQHGICSGGTYYPPGGATTPQSWPSGTIDGWDEFSLLNVPVVTQSYEPPQFISGDTPSAYDGYSVSYSIYTPGGWTTTQVGNAFDFLGGSAAGNGGFSIQGPPDNRPSIQAAPKPSCFDFYVEQLIGVSPSGLISFLFRDTAIDSAGMSASPVMYDSAFRSAVREIVPSLGMSNGQFAWLGRNLKWAGTLAAVATDVEATIATEKMIQAKFNGGCTSPSW
ncbi:MAG TPA: RHS repeat-associated core domain-containing protein [Terriglobia bacterium]|nr:RHS repeat-associated core domain-containing protein [Terriglobia bacterium]